MSSPITVTFVNSITFPKDFVKIEQQGRDALYLTREQAETLYVTLKMKLEQ